MSRTLFKSDGIDFSAIRAAGAHLDKMGYSRGSMECSNPIGVTKHQAYISKWTRMSGAEHDKLDGYLESADFRSGDVTLVMKDGDL